MVVSRKKRTANLEWPSSGCSLPTEMYRLIIDHLLVILIAKPGSDSKRKGSLYKRLVMKVALVDTAFLQLTLEAVHAQRLNLEQEQWQVERKVQSCECWNSNPRRYCCECRQLRTEKFRNKDKRIPRVQSVMRILENACRKFNFHGNAKVYMKIQEEGMFRQLMQKQKERSADSHYHKITESSNGTLTCHQQALEEVVPGGLHNVYLALDWETWFN